MRLTDAQLGVNNIATRANDRRAGIGFRIVYPDTVATAQLAAYIGVGAEIGNAVNHIGTLRPANQYAAGAVTVG